MKIERQGRNKNFKLPDQYRLTENQTVDPNFAHLSLLVKHAI
jgi:hypothetical protein